MNNKENVPTFSLTRNSPLEREYNRRQPFQEISRHPFNVIPSTPSPVGQGRSINAIQSPPLSPAMQQFECCSLCLTRLIPGTVINLQVGVGVSLVGHVHANPFILSTNRMMSPQDFDTYLQHGDDGRVIVLCFQGPQDLLRISPRTYGDDATRGHMRIKTLNLKSPPLSSTDWNNYLSQYDHVDTCVAVANRFLRELESDSRQSLTVITVKQQIQLRHRTLHNRKLAKRLKRCEGKLDDAVCQSRDPASIATAANQELTSPKLNELSEFVESVVLPRQSRLKRDTYEFSQSLLRPEDWVAIIDRWEASFPIQYQLNISSLMSSSTRQRKGRYEELVGSLGFRRLAFLVFMASERSNKDLFVSLATSLALGFYGLGVGKTSLDIIAQTGRCTSYSHVYRVLHPKRAPGDPVFPPFLARMEKLIIYFDNWQRFVRFKALQGAHNESLAALHATQVYVRKIWGLDLPTSTPWPVNEGQPPLDYSGKQIIPAVIGMLPYELVREHGDNGAVFLFSNIEKIRSDPSILSQFLDLPRLIPFDVNEMQPSNGERVVAYKHYVSLARDITNLNRFLGNKNTFMKIFPEYSSSSSADEIFDLFHQSRGFLSKIKNFQREAVRQYNPHADRVSEVHWLKMLSHNELSSEGVLSVIISIFHIVGILLERPDGTVTLCENWEDRLYGLGGDQKSIAGFLGISRKLFTGMKTWSNKFALQEALAKAVTRIVPLTGDLHFHIHFCAMLFHFFYDDVFRAFKIAINMKRVNADPVIAFQNSRHLMKMGHGELLAYESKAFLDWLRHNPPPADESDPKIRIVRLMRKRGEYCCWIDQCDDDVLRLVWRLSSVLTMFFEIDQSMDMSDSVFMEALYNDSAPYMALVKKHNYRDLPNTKNRALYEQISAERRDEFRVNNFLRGNKGSNPKAADDGCEEMNLREKSLPPTKTVATAVERSEHLCQIKQCVLLLEDIAGKLDDDGNHHIQTSVPPSVVAGKKRINELIGVSKLFEYQEGRKLEALSALYTLIPTLKSDLPSVNRSGSSDEVANVVERTIRSLSVEVLNCDVNERAAQQRQVEGADVDNEPSHTKHSEFLPLFAMKESPRQQGLELLKKSSYEKNLKLKERQEAHHIDFSRRIQRELEWTEHVHPVINPCTVQPTWRVNCTCR